MKKIILISATFLGAVAFGQRTPVIGGDKDAFGCKPSAGYTYSKIQDKCIRAFEQKIKLNEVNPQKSYTSMAAVIFSDDMNKAEVFMPDIKLTSLVLTRAGKRKIWKNGSYVLVPHKKKGYQLKKDNVVIYQ